MLLALTFAANPCPTCYPQVLADACPLLSSLSLAHCTQFSDRGLAAALTAMLLRPVAPDGSSEPLRRLDLSFIQASVEDLAGAADASY